MRRRAIILFVVAALAFCWVATGTAVSASEHHHARAVLGTAQAEGHLRVTATPKLPRDPSTGIANATLLIVALVIFSFLVVNALVAPSWVAAANDALSAGTSIATVRLTTSSV